MKSDKDLISIFFKYADFVDMFTKDLAAKLLRYIKINNHAIDMIKNQQPLYEPIYSHKPVELEALKHYIEINLTIGFIKPSKYFAGTLIFFVKKLNISSQLYISY